jgi:2-polyprenyl-3-methyl-5-hydroxy-6-metoxy-1,4-benzoquinol methylase
MFIDDLKPGKILDVGCGDGAFLNLMRGRGWSVEGVDVDAKAVARAKAKYGLELRCSNLRAAGFPHDTFDAITLSHVIEHVPDPPGLLAEMARVLKPGGRLVATTPNIRSRGHKTFQRDWRGLEPPRHLNIFSLNALRECARRAGLEVVETTSTAANADIIAGGSFFIRHFNQRLDRNAPLPKINLVRALRSMLFQYAEFFSLRNDPHAGEEAVLICGKKPA